VSAVLNLRFLLKQYWMVICLRKIRFWRYAFCYNSSTLDPKAAFCPF